MTGPDLKSHRKALGYSLTELSDALRMGANGPTHLREMEAGKRPVTGPIQTAVRLMVERVGLEFTIADLTSDEGHA